jgi:phosphoribosylaminoimidazole carboxylase (NCAIR synthetase)
MPLLVPERYMNVTMKNIIGGVDFNDVSMKNRKLYIYGKSEIRSGRKMGHINILKKRGAK